MENQAPFFEWPEISFKEIENVKVDNAPTRIFYKSFFTVLRLPQTIIEEFRFLMTANDKN